jgi:hypothetical protein
MADNRPRPELCVGTYRARKAPGTVLLYAEGAHPTTGYQTFWTHDVSDGAKAELSLWHVRPTGNVLQVITPFSLCTSFQTTEEVRTVTVHDGAGPHVVPVEDTPKAVLAHGE